MEFNPKLEDFLKENKDITMLKMAWALTWRLNVVVLGVYAGIIALAFMFS